MIQMLNCTQITILFLTFSLTKCMHSRMLCLKTYVSVVLPSVVFAVGAKQIDYMGSKCEVVGHPLRGCHVLERGRDYSHLIWKNHEQKSNYLQFSNLNFFPISYHFLTKWLPTWNACPRTYIYVLLLSLIFL